MIVSWAIDVRGALEGSARNAMQASFFDAARKRAEPEARAAEPNDGLP